MAITIAKQAAFTGVANNTNIFQVTSNSSSNAQFRAVADIFNRNAPTVRLQRIKQQPNASGNAIFDIASVLQAQLTDPVPTPVSSTALWTRSSTEAMRYIVKWGEEWGASPSSSVAVYPGNSNTAGSPAVSGSNFYFVWNGLADPNDKLTAAATSYNWVTTGKWFPTTPTPTAGTNVFKRQVCLTDMPRTASIRNDELLAVSFLQGNEDTTFVTTNQAQDIYAYDIKVYDSSNTLLLTITQYNTTGGGAGGGPRAASNVLWSDATAQSNYSSTSAGTTYSLMGALIGPAQHASWRALNWSYAIATLYGQSSIAPALDTTAIWDQFRLNRSEAACGYEGIRFAWKNEYGVYDFYTFDLQLDKRVNIARESYEQNFVNYSNTSTLGIFTGIRQRRGMKNFYDKIEETWTANSDWLNQETANWLKELFYSANVFYYSTTYSSWLPITISSAEVVEKTNPRTQTMFQYQISLMPANQPNPRL